MVDYANSARRNRFKAANRAARSRCWLCGGRIDYDATVPHPLSFTVDHAVPRSLGTVPPSRRSNWRPAHYECNQDRGDEMVDIFSSGCEFESLPFAALLGGL